MSIIPNLSFSTTVFPRRAAETPAAHNPFSIPGTFPLAVSPAGLSYRALGGSAPPLNCRLIAGTLAKWAGQGRGAAAAEQDTGGSSCPPTLWPPARQSPLPAPGVGLAKHRPPGSSGGGKHPTSALEVHTHSSARRPHVPLCLCCRCPGPGALISRCCHCRGPGALVSLCRCRGRGRCPGQHPAGSRGKRIPRPSGGSAPALG